MKSLSSHNKKEITIYYYIQTNIPLYNCNLIFTILKVIY